MNLYQQQSHELARWRPLPKWQGAPVFQRLLDNEFQNRRESEERINRRLRELIQFSVKNVPYYQELFALHDIDADSICSFEDLRSVPILDRTELQANAERIRASALPSNHAVAGSTKTSGSTGQPVEVLHTLFSFQFFTFLKHRECRWWGMDPSKTMASVRPAVDLPEKSGLRLKDGEMLEQAGWPLLSNMFRTGRALSLADTNEPEYVIDWLKRHSPSYLTSMAAVLEHLSFAVSEDTGLALEQTLSISQQMTPEMRSLIESKFCPIVNENYGFNEIGVVASRCPASGYYHVHSEHCLVEIIDEDGKHCLPGKSGKLVVTGLNNLAMPLIRYDADDMAEVPVIPCPCGRTLPSFTNLKGRYRRTAHLPKGTWDYWGALLDGISGASDIELASLKQYQLHQKTANQFVLRLATSGQLPSSFLSLINGCWNGVENELKATLVIDIVDEIEKSGKKFQNFVSDLVPSLDD